jgi:hypothetical protein
MQAGCRGGEQALIAHHEAPNMAQPRERPLAVSPSPVPPQLSPILIGRTLGGSLRGDDGLETPTGQTDAQRRAVIAPLRHLGLGALAGTARPAEAADGDGVEELLAAGDCRRTCRLHGCSHRRTRALDQHLPLCPLAAFRLANVAPLGGRA